MMGDVTLFGVSVAMLVVLLVQGLKLLGMPDRFAPWAALVLSGLGALAAELVMSVPGSVPYIRTIVAGVVVFLVSTGIYHVGKNVKENLV
jgi:hypothetical protein